MNANELADDMENGAFNDANYNKKKAADFVRQQQAEIKELKQQVAFLEDWRDTWSPTIKQLMNINVKVQEK